MKGSNSIDVLFCKRAGLFMNAPRILFVRPFRTDYPGFLISGSRHLPKGENHTDDGSHLIIGSRSVVFMKIRARAFLQSTLLLSLAAGPLVPDAVAGSQTVTSYAGTVNPKLPNINFPDNVQAGDSISGSFGFNGSQFTGNSTTGIYTFTGSAPLGQSFTLNVATPTFNPALWSDAYGAGGATFMITMTGSTTPGAKLDLHVSTLGGTGVTKSGAFIDLVLTSSTYVGKALPTSANIGDFLTHTATLTWDPSDTPQGFTATIDQFNGQTVPEPSSLVLAIVALATCTAGFLISRRKPAGALQSGRIAPLPHS